MEHLNNKTRELIANCSPEERIMMAKKFIWIGYTQSIDIFKKLEDLKNYPKVYRMPNLLLVGDSNNGKTAILRKYSERNEAYIRSIDSQVINPVVYVQAPPEPDEKRFYNIILDSLFAPTKTTEKIDSRQQRVINLLKKMETQLLMIDEIHHVLAGSSRKQRTFLNVIKFLSNELQIPIICAGTKDAFNAIQTDPQLSNRFEPKVLPKWTNDLEYKRLLASFEKVLPLKKESLLIENSIADNILSKSDGLIGEISKILELACIKAIETSKEKIDNQIIDSIDYIPPFKRRKQILY
ncbi:TniB family NTP-binding protein [Myroides odoratimimus]|uniref:TniB family NTP-binding protein n=1 Tax=Myroides odoratimimus TaxID=76832 RepID=UPI002574DE4B|nr:TniB family NTP-binding protein [Myroides odoratimimus]MDM1397765.1 TniB family NTP-binding protein [Myroides odoratimimus]